MEYTSYRRFSYSFGLLVFLLTLLLGAGGALAVVTPGGTLPDQAAAVFDQNHPAVQAVMKVQERHTASLLGQPGVVGTATGLGADGRPAVMVLLESFNAARGAVIPSMLDGVPTTVKIIGKVVALGKGGIPGPPNGSNDSNTCVADPTTRSDRPVPIGVSTGHPSITAGTIGVRVTNGTNVYALSNNHVYADENLASFGDAALQPGTYDGGSDPADAIGTLADYEPIDFTASGQNEIDAAIALSSTVELGNATPCDGYGTPKSTTLAPSVNLKVQKYGRTTGETRGQIYAINATLNIGYDSGTALFVNQIVIVPGGFSAGGDSGSLIVADGKGKDKAVDRRPVGLLFAGSSTITIANPIDPVLARFGVTIDGE